MSLKETLWNIFLLLFTIFHVSDEKTNGVESSSEKKQNKTKMLNLSSQTTFSVIMVMNLIELPLSSEGKSGEVGSQGCMYQVLNDDGALVEKLVYMWWEVVELFFFFAKSW